MRRKRIDPYVEQILKRAELEVSALFMDFGEGRLFLEAFNKALN
jgi:hypothetical protein